MKDENFLKANNARHMWHPMTSPADSLANPPRIITKGSGVLSEEGRESNFNRAKPRPIN